MAKYFHSLHSDRRCPDRFSVGAAIFGSLWAFSEGMRVVGGRFYVFDALISFGSIFAYAALTWFFESSVAIAIGVTIFISARIWIGFLAPRYLQHHLASLGYRRST
jgi:hypothetical protein